MLDLVNLTLKNQDMFFGDTIASMLTLGQKVLLSRKDLRLTQVELASLAGVSRSHIANIENERVTNVGLDVANQIAGALGVSPAYLLGMTENPLQGLIDEDDDEEESASAISEWSLPVIRLATLASELPDDKVESLIALAERYVEAERDRDGEMLKMLLIEARRLKGDAFADQLLELVRHAVDVMSR